MGPAIQGFQGSSLDLFIPFFQRQIPKTRVFLPFMQKQKPMSIPRSSRVHPMPLCSERFCYHAMVFSGLFVCFGILESSEAALPGPEREMLLYQGTRNAFILHLGDTKTQTDDETLKSCSHRFRDVMRKETGQQSPLSASSSKYSLQKARLATSFAAY